MVDYIDPVLVDPLGNLWDSTADLFERFDLEVNLDVQARKLSEEFTEFLKATINYERWHIYEEFTHDNYVEQERKDYQTDMAREAVDMLVVALVLCQSAGINYNQFRDAVEFVIDKNDSKTLYTHKVEGGKIVKI